MVPGLFSCSAAFKTGGMVSGCSNHSRLLDDESGGVQCKAIIVLLSWEEMSLPLQAPEASMTRESGWSFGISDDHTGLWKMSS